MFVKPVKGALVRDPNTLLPLPEAGMKVEKTSYWLRRLAQGDVELVEKKTKEGEK